MSRGNFQFHRKPRVEMYAPNMEELFYFVILSLSIDSYVCKSDKLINALFYCGRWTDMILGDAEMRRQSYRDQRHSRAKPITIVPSDKWLGGNRMKDT